MLSNNKPITQPIVQISLDTTNLGEALETARIAVRAGVDWLGVGRPLLLAEGLHTVRALHREFPELPLVVNLMTMDDGYREVEMTAGAGATHVVVMSKAHTATVKQVVRAGRDFDVKVMGGNLGEENKVVASRRMQDLGVDYIVHHVGQDERSDAFIRAKLGRMPSALDELAQVVAAVKIPVQAVGGLTVEQSITLLRKGAPIVVLDASAVSDARQVSENGDFESSLRELVTHIRQSGA